MGGKIEKMRIAVEGAGEVVGGIDATGLDARWMLGGWAMGQGAGMRHAFMEALAGELVRVGVADIAVSFSVHGRRARSSGPAAKVLTGDGFFAGRSACGEAGCSRVAAAGGRQIEGGRMSRQAAADGFLNEVRGTGIFWISTCIQPKSSRERSGRRNIFPRWRCRCCFLQGTRDGLADLRLLRPICKELWGAGYFAVGGRRRIIRFMF